MAFNKENKITWEELAPSLQELFKGLQTQITNEYERATREEQRIEGRLNYEILRATEREDWLEADYNKLINQIWGSDGRLDEHNITEIWAKLEELEELIDENMKIALFEQINIIWNYPTNSRATDGLLPSEAVPNRLNMHYSKTSTTSGKSDTSLEIGVSRLHGHLILPHSGTVHINIPAVNIIPFGYNPGTSNTELNVQTGIYNYSKPVSNEVRLSGFIASSSNTADQLSRRTNEYGHAGVSFDIPNCSAGEIFAFSIELTGYTELHNFDKNDWQNDNPDFVMSKINGNCQSGAKYYSINQFFQQMSMS